MFAKPLIKSFQYTLKWEMIIGLKAEILENLYPFRAKSRSQ